MELLQQAIFLPAHSRRVAGGVMIESMKMQYPVDQEAVNGHIERDSVFFRLTPGFIDGDDNITYVVEFKRGDGFFRIRVPGAVRTGRPGRKREDIGRLIDFPEAPVERAHGPVAYDGDIERNLI